MEVAQQENFAAMRQKRIDQMAKMHHQISSPKLREMLKEVRSVPAYTLPHLTLMSFQKCRIRMKESRHNLHDGRRLIDTMERRNVVSQILKEEILEFEKDIEKMELIYREMMEEADQWLYEEMELAEEIAIDRLLDGDDIFCPVCQKSNLHDQNESVISCACGVRFSFGQGLKVLHGNILRLVSDHERSCNTRLTFFAEPSSITGGSQDLSSLNAYCATCEFYSTLIV